MQFGMKRRKAEHNKNSKKQFNENILHYGTKKLQTESFVLFMLTFVLQEQLAQRHEKNSKSCVSKY